MLGTIRPTQREYLGCLIGRVDGGTVYVERWVPARGMKQLQLAVAGSCDSIPGVVGTWHTHPYRADLNNLPVKEPALSAQDLETFAKSRWAATLVMWDEDSLDAAARGLGRQAGPSGAGPYRVMDGASCTKARTAILRRRPSETKAAQSVSESVPPWYVICPRLSRPSSTSSPSVVARSTLRQPPARKRSHAA